VLSNLECRCRSLGVVIGDTWYGLAYTVGAFLLPSFPLPTHWQG
jgi:hypothetical protein